MNAARCLVAALSAVLAPLAESQTPVVLGPPACADCVISLRRMVSLGSADGDAMLESSSHLVLRDSRNRWYIANGESPYFWVFDAAGKLVRRVGRLGDGPGEFRVVTTLAIGANDTVFVFESRNRRMTILAPDYSYVRSGTLLFASNFDAAAFGNAVVINVDARARDGAQPLRLIAPDARVIRSFGTTDTVYVPNQGFGTRRALARAAPDAVWMAHLNKYVIERWDTAGRRTAALSREADWFRPWTTSVHSPDVPPLPHLVSISTTGDTLWTILEAPGPNWRRAVEPMPGGRTFRITDESVYRNVIVEAIDLRTRRVIASSRVTTRILGLLAPSLAYSTSAGPDGSPLVTIWQLSIDRPSRN